MFHPDFTSPIQERYRQAGVGLAKGPQDSQGLEHFACEERLRELGLSSPDKGRSVGPHPSLPVPTKRIWRIQSQALHCGAWWEDTRQWEEGERGEVQPGHKESFFPHELRQVLEQVTQRGCAVSVLGYFPTRTESSLEQLGLTLVQTGCTADFLRSLPAAVLL